MDEKVIQQAEFNPKIRHYIFWITTLIMFISVAGIPLLFFWILGLGKYTSKNYYNSLECRLSSTKLSYKKGFLFKVEKNIPLENIQDLTFIDNPILKYFGLKVIKIETASNNPNGLNDMKLTGIINPEAFRDNILNARNDLNNRKNSAPQLTPQNEVVQLLKDIKEILIQKNSN